jgi:hypothetical protein
MKFSLRSLLSGRKKRPTARQLEYRTCVFHDIHCRKKDFLSKSQLLACAFDSKPFIYPRAHCAKRGESQQWVVSAHFVKIKQTTAFDLWLSG